MTTLEIYTDPGHGWAKVSRKELSDLGILNKVSHYSYQNLEFVYLEEDCDLSLYLLRLKELGVKVDGTITHHTNEDSPVRSYRPFRP